jgi:hypothetical protein
VVFPVKRDLPAAAGKGISDLPFAPLIESLNALTIEVRGLRGDLAARHDPAAAALLHAIHDYVGTGAEFSAAEIISEADERLCAALGDLDAYALGRQLGCLEGRIIDGLTVVRNGRDEAGNIWSIALG